MTFDPYIAAYTAAAVSLVLLVWIIRLEIKIHRLTKGHGGSLEDIIVDAHKKIAMLDQFRRDSLAYFGDLEKRVGRSVQAVRTLRFNPFKGTGDGGNQSFSTALITEHGDGVVISSLYSRDRVSIFSKPLEKFESQFELSDEEKEVINHSKELLKS